MFDYILFKSFESLRNFIRVMIEVWWLLSDTAKFSERLYLVSDFWYSRYSVSRLITFRLTPHEVHTGGSSFDLKHISL